MIMIGTTEPVPGYITVPSVQRALNKENKKPKKRPAANTNNDFSGLTVPLPPQDESTDQPQQAKQVLILVINTSIF